MPVDLNKLIEETKKAMEGIKQYGSLIIEGDTILPIHENEVVLVYGVAESGKSSFLFSVCGLILLNNEDVSITYFDVDGKDMHRAKVLVDMFGSRFTYIHANRLTQDEFLELLPEIKSEIIVVDMYHLLLNDKKYYSFFVKLRDILFRYNKTILLSTEVYKTYSETLPRGGYTAGYTSNYSISIKKVPNSRYKRLIEETRYGVISPSKLKVYNGHFFFDFFVDKLVGESDGEANE